MLITSLNNDKIKEIGKLKDKKYRDKNNMFFVEGLHDVDEAYKAGLIREMYVLDGEECNYDVPIIYVSDQVMKKISDMESISDYFAVCNKKKDEVIGNRVLMLDGIQDPGNLGTIIRSAVAFKIDTIILNTNCVDLYNSKVIRSTKGMLFNINIVVRDLCELIPKMNEYTIYGTDVINGNNIRNEKLSDKIAIIIGNEGNGISDEVKSLCEKFIYIDMSDKCESLNAAVAASILMYEVMNK